MRRCSGFLIGVLLAAGAVAQDPGTPGEVERLLQRHDCQTTLPGERVVENQPGRRRQDPGERESSSFRTGLGVPAGLAEFLMWAIVAGAVAFVVIAVARSFGHGEGDVPSLDPIVGRTAPATEAAAMVLEDHAALAARGDFAAAIRALLGHAIAAWVERRGVLPKAETAREFLRRVRGAGVDPQVLLPLVQQVEFAWFGGRPVASAHYEQSIQQLKEWVAACQTLPRP